MAKEKIIGIDLGTSNSAACVLEAGRPRIVPSAEGASLYGKSFPSVVAFTEDGQILVGEPARRQAVSNPKGTVMAAKRKMGTNFKYDVYGKKYSPQQISAFVLQKIKKDAEDFLGEKVEKAVITVPAYFDDNQRQATKDAGKIAGLDVVRIVNEPTAASLAYGLDKKDKEEKILVFDFGGGTLDVTIMDFSDGVFQVKSTSGDTQLGGTDMDDVLINYIVESFKKEHGVDLNDDITAMQRVREAAEKAKIELSTTLESDINLPYITATDKGPKHLQMKLKRSKLEELVTPLVDRCKKSVEQSLKDAGLTTKDLTKVILVGGPTRMPLVQKKVEQWCGNIVERGIDPMECVATGAAIQGGVLAGEVKDILLLDVTPLSLGIETLGGLFTKLIERNTTIPTKKQQVFSTAADNQTVVTIRVFQGERAMANDNKNLGQFDLVGIPPAPRGVPKIEVTFDIDANGILNITAKDQGTGKEQSLRITAPSKLSDEEVEKMKKAAEEFAEQDKKRKEEVEIINQADTLIYTTETSMKEMEGKVDEADVKAIKDKVEELKELMKPEKKDVDAIKKKLEEVTEVAGKAAQKLYAQAGDQGAEKSNAQSDSKADAKKDKKADKEVDAEVVDEKKDKKAKK
ncbi:molecular chaperone DnaK [Candidatus Woesearchaeota archaeon]|nr:molecular chaperone DnaK [Candidatus Woesearchaeota archaeon]